MPIPKPETVNLPPVTFLYTLDQVAGLLQYDLRDFKNKYVYFTMANVGDWHNKMVRAQNIAPDGQAPDWRISQDEFLRWMRLMGFRVVKSTAIT